MYLEDSLVEMNIFTASKQKSIHGWARLTGHNASRGTSAQGTLRIRIKPGAAQEQNFSFLRILDQTKLISESNNLPYFIQLGSVTESILLEGISNEFVNVKLIQGELEEQTKTGTGKNLQSFTLTAKKPIDNENVFVKVNGEPFEIVDSLYDMIKGDKQCLVKTGISGGIDVYFGNEDFGYIPPAGSRIVVTYVLTDGYAGNIFSKSNQVKFQWKDPGFSNIGDELDLNEILITEVDKPVLLGADAEDSSLTKLIAPKTSRSYVLANPDTYVSYLSRFNYSYVDAYTTFDDEYIDDDNIVYLFLVPDIQRRLNTSTDYWKTNLTNFTLTEDEKNALKLHLNQSGRQIIGTEISIVDPILKKYAVNIFLRIFDTSDANTLKTKILETISMYFLTVTRRDKVPKSDLVAKIEAIKGVDSVNITFTSATNEQAIIDGFYTKKSTTFDSIRGLQTVTETKVTLTENQDPNLGLDDFGDIKIGLNELPVIRGDFFDRFGNYYEDSADLNKYSAVNIVIQEVIKETMSVKMSNKNKDNI
jgi:hypothetical protein